MFFCFFLVERVLAVIWTALHQGFFFNGPFLVLVNGTLSLILISYYTGDRLDNSSYSCVVIFMS